MKGIDFNLNAKVVVQVSDLLYECIHFSLNEMKYHCAEGKNQCSRCQPVPSESESGYFTKTSVTLEIPLASCNQSLVGSAENVYHEMNSVDYLSARQGLTLHSMQYQRTSS